MPGEAFGFRHRSRQTSLCASSWRGHLLSPQLSGEWFSAATNGALDLFPRLAVPPFLVWSEAPLQTHFSSPGACWCQASSPVPLFSSLQA